MIWRGPVMLENSNHWEGQVVDATLTLRTFLGGSSRSAVYLVDYPAEAEHGKAAVKLIPADPGDPQDADAQLARWKRIAELSHPHLLRLLQVGRCTLDQIPLLYVVMELADENLSEILPHRALTAEETGEMLAPTLDALAYLHEKGFAHTAVKPANIMAVGERLKISSDRLVAIGERYRAVPVPDPYSPPEATRGVISPVGEVSPEGDIWSLGITLVEVLSQTVPTSEWVSSEGPPLPAALPQPFLDIARHCLRREAKRRWTITQIQARMKLPAASDLPEKIPQPRTAVAPRVSSKIGWYAALVIAAALLTAVFLAPRFFHHGAQAVPTALSPTSPSPAQQDSPTSASQLSASDEAVAATPPPAPAPQDANLPSDTAAANPVVKRVLPELLPSARDTIQGTIRVAIRLSIDSAGNITASSFDYRGPSGYFADKAMEAVRQWKFSPDARNVPGDWLVRFEITRTSINTFADPADR